MEQVDKSGDQRLSGEVEYPNKDTDHQNAAHNDQSVLQNLLGGGPNDLLKFAAELTEVFADSTPGFYKPVFLFDVCHFAASLLGLVVNGVLSAESAVLLHFETVGIVLLVLHCVVVSLLALGASQSDFNAHKRHLLKFASLYHSGYLKFSKRPTTIAAPKLKWA